MVSGFIAPHRRRMTTSNFYNMKSMCATDVTFVLYSTQETTKNAWQHYSTRLKLKVFYRAKVAILQAEIYNMLRN